MLAANRPTRLLALLLVMLGGCGQPSEPAPEPPRAIKYLVLQARAGEQVRRIAGVTEADVVTDLAFDIPGQLIAIVPNVGDLVSAGAAVARIDPEPYRLQLLTAEGQLEQAQSRVTEAQSQYERIAAIFQKGFVTQAELDKASADVESARGSLQIARTQVAIAERDLQRTSLVSPLTGRVTDRYVEQFAEVNPRQPILQISSEGRLKVKASVPESLIGELSLGDAVTVTLPGDGATLPGRLTEIGSRATSASSFPVEVTLDRVHDEIRPGMTAEVAFSFRTEATGDAFLLPIGAVLAAESDGSGYVFVFDRERSVVDRRPVVIVNVRDNRLEVRGDLAEGDIIAAAGVPFLHDGMPVRLMAEPAS